MSIESDQQPESPESWSVDACVSRNGYEDERGFWCTSHQRVWVWTEEQHCSGVTPERAREVQRLSRAYHEAQKYDLDGLYPDPCARCGLRYGTGMPDPCIGVIPGADEACCGHDGKLQGEDEPYIIFPPDDPNFIQDGSTAYTRYIRVYFPLGTDSERVKAVGLAIADALGRGGEGGRITRAELRDNAHFLERHKAKS